ncbi:DUF6731 family protein [Endozoicomonas elysicola]|uniref:Uncharacterized protein n=1 Tax=Endozoicomonas elysicola TaxID=305900 RepID=A0A081K844_9GAMM|nr:DUF6731 family protein [Endozoicomonas elysicola]KEI70320.1 hypothetical protein GV64_05860 [Endozoicomonas elysicola]
MVKVTTKKFYFDFYQCDVRSSNQLPTMSMEGILSHFKSLFDGLETNTVRKVAGREIELRSIEITDYGYRGTVGKYRKANLPHAAVPGGEEREIDLNENEHLLEKAYFKYFSDYSLIIFQRNRYAISSDYFSHYLSINGYNVSLNPIIEPADLQRLMDDEVQLRAATLTIARPTNPALFENVEHDFNNTIIQSLNSSNAATVNLILRGDGHSGDPEKRYLDSSLKRAFLELKNKFDVKKADLVLEDGGISHPLDLVTDRLVFDKDITISGRYPSSSDMWSAIWEARSEKEVEVSSYFGTLDQERLA